ARPARGHGRHALLGHAVADQAAPATPDHLAGIAGLRERRAGATLRVRGHGAERARTFAARDARRAVRQRPGDGETFRRRAALEEILARLVGDRRRARLHGLRRRPGPLGVETGQAAELQSLLARRLVRPLPLEIARRAIRQAQAARLRDRRARLVL